MSKASFMTEEKRANNEIFETALQWGVCKRGVFVHSAVNTAAPGISTQPHC